MDKKPLVSIGMPTYNGERFIRQVLDSLLAQDYKNFELIISDNASTDNTRNICLEYAAKDKRIRYCRSKKNLGAIKNFYRAFQLSSGKYFMFAGSHDLWHQTFISRCVDILENESEVVIAYSRTMLIDTEDKPIEIMSDQIDTRGMSHLKRYKYLIKNLVWCNMIYGVIRCEAFARIKWFRTDWGFDNLLLAELSLEGSFAQIREPLFYRRKISDDEKDFEKLKKRVFYAIDPENAAKKCRRPIEYIRFQFYYSHIKMLLQYNLSFCEKIDLISYSTFVFLFPLMIREIGRILRKIGLLKNSY
jgi:glycosyltransferase involved in cell wall biosynthesis